MTDVYNAFHPPSANDVLAKFEIGELDESVIPTGLYANKLVPQKQKDFEMHQLQIYNLFLQHTLYLLKSRTFLYTYHLH